MPIRHSGAAGCSPVVSGDIVYVSKAYGVGSAACKITKADGAYAGDGDLEGAAATTKATIGQRRWLSMAVFTEFLARQCIATAPLQVH